MYVGHTNSYGDKVRALVKPIKVVVFIYLLYANEIVLLCSISLIQVQ